MEPAQITPDAGHRDLGKTATAGWRLGVPRQFLPFCESNGDYYCLAPDDQVVFWSHNGWSAERWPDLAHWIQQVWIAEFQEMQSEESSDYPAHAVDAPIALLFHIGHHERCATDARCWAQSVTFRRQFLM